MGMTAAADLFSRELAETIAVIKALDAPRLLWLRQRFEDRAERLAIALDKLAPKQGSELRCPPRTNVSY